MRDLPSGEITMLFTDIDGSTRLLRELGDRYTDVLTEHRRVLRNAFTQHAGVEVDTQGDAFFVAFERAQDAVGAAIDAQKALAGSAVRVRMGLHSGRPQLTAEGYVGMDVHRCARIAAAGHGGQILASRSTVEALADAAFEPRDLGEHRLKDIPDPEWLFQLSAPGLMPDFPPLRTPSNTNLPTPGRRMVDRERELADICTCIRAGDARAVTVTGAGGTGKTRLAVQAGLELVEHFPNGVFFVGLAPLTASRLVIPAIAQTLGVREGAGESPLATVTAHLRIRRLMLVLDNFEHVVDAAADVAELLAGAPELSVLVTSREPLRIDAEREYPLAPLEEAAAVELFANRACAVDPTFRPDSATAEICRRLDGLPLAIELAAARVRLLPPQTMLERLGRRLPFLTSGGRDRPARQRTLHATIDWSHELLSPSERQLFRRIAVFAGGCSLEAGETVCEADPAVLESLVQKSLVLQRPDYRGSARFSMLATVREYAADCLADAGDEATTRRRHASWVLQLAESAEPRLLGRGQVEWLARLEQEIANIRAAVTSSLTLGDMEIAVRITAALIDFWDARGSYVESASWLEHGLAHLGDQVDPILRARGLLAAGLAACQGANPEKARTLTSESLALGRKAADSRLASRALSQLATVAMLRGEFLETIELAREGAALATKAGDDTMRAFALNMLAVGKYETGHRSEAEALFDEAAGLLRAIGDHRDLAIVQGNVGGVALLNGDYQRALAVFESAITLSEELGDRGRLPSHHQGMGLASLLDGSLEAAASHLSIALVDGQQVGDTPTVISAVIAVAGLMALRGDDRAAGVLRGAVNRAVADSGIRLSGSDTLVDERLLSDVTDPHWSTALDEGTSLRLDDAIDYALAALQQSP